MQEFLNSILASMADVIIVVNHEGVIKYASPQTYRVFGSEVREIVGKKIWEIPNLKDFRKMEEFFSRLKAGKFRKKREIFEFIRGELNVYLQVYATVLQDSKDFVLVFRDITPLIEAQKKIEDLNDVLRLINKILRHDVLNKLALIRGFLEISLEEFRKENIEKTLKFVDEAVELLNRMKEVESSLIGGQLKVVNVREVLEDVAVNYRRQGIEIAIAGEAKVMADDAIYSVFDNIFSNAVKHGGARRIDVTIKIIGDFCRISIEDDGKGLPVEILGKLFTEGFKYGEKAGSGPGLYIVKKVVEGYGGTVTAYNKRGAVFEISLKCAEV